MKSGQARTLTVRSRRYRVAMSAIASFYALAAEPFVSLTTFRRSGEAVSTPVWIARDGDDLIVTTPKHSGKVKRLRNSGEVELRPCDRMGKVKTGAPMVAGTAAILDDDASREHLTGLFRAKYRAEYRIFMFIERLGRSGRKDRVMLRISAV